VSVRLTGPPPDARAARLDRVLLRRRVLRILREIGHSRSELSVCLVDDEEIAALNRSWRGRSGPTDVLSFSLCEGEHRHHRGRLLGDVVIGIETAAREARRRHRGIDDEVARLLVHGVLHLVGHDHEDESEARRMRTEERRLRRALQ
jgi:probable rRNA maturation factor